jgi:hypothetical protein
MDDQEWVARQQAAMTAIAPIFDELEAAINASGPIDMVTAYLIALGAVRAINMDKTTLEQFVAVLMADRTYTAVT